MTRFMLPDLVKWGGGCRIEGWDWINPKMLCNLNCVLYCVVTFLLDLRDQRCSREEKQCGPIEHSLVVPAYTEFYCVCCNLHIIFIALDAHTHAWHNFHWERVHVVLKVHQIDAFHVKTFFKSSRGSMPPDPPRGGEVHPQIKQVKIIAYIFF